MEPTDYTYKKKLWRRSPTVSGNNSFFHSAFGVKNDEEEYFDKHAKMRRLRWSAFLTYYENEVMQPCLEEILRRCFSVDEKFKEASIEDEDSFSEYISEINKKAVTIEEIPILSILENINLVVFTDTPEPVVVEPNPQILGFYPSISEKPKEEVVLCLEGNTFSRLQPTIQKPNKKTVEKKVEESNSSSLQYEKGGDGGGKGIDFQIGLLTVFVLNAFRKLSTWQLATEHKHAGKFDDVVLECPQGAILLQAKHREDRKRKINFSQLILKSKSDDFNLGKYFLSYQEIKSRFKVKNVIICTNAGVKDDVLKFLDPQSVCSDSLLHYQDEVLSFYKFNDEILPHLKKSVQTRTVDETIITDDELIEFQTKLEFYVNYPQGNQMEKVIEQLLLPIIASSNLYEQISTLEIYTKVRNWFQQKSGVYFTDSYVKAMFFEISRDKHFQKLKQYEVQFQNNTLNFLEPKRIFYFTVANGYLLQELELFQALQNNRHLIMYIKPKDNIDRQKQIIETFGQRRYTFLIFLQPRIREKQQINDMCLKLIDILKTYDHKKVIFVARPYNSLVQQIISNRNDYEIIEKPITSKDLAVETRQRLFKQKNIVFQGTHVSLEELFAPQLSEHFEDTVSLETLENLARNEDTVVGCKVQCVNENINKCYISRKFKKAEEDSKSAKKRGDENLCEENIYEVNEKIVLIADVAGMGKSTVLAKLAEDIKSKYPHLWVIRIELNNYSKFYKNLQAENRQTMSLIEVLNANDQTKLKYHLEEVVFALKGKVVLLLDGVDEISPDYTSLVMNLLLQCQKASNFQKIFVTTRPHMAKQLEQRLQVESLILLPFTEEDQIEFLTNYWTYHLRLDDDTDIEKCQRYAEILMNKIRFWINSDRETASSFAAIPLQVRMLAEIFQQSSEWGGCKKYLDTNEGDPKLPNYMNITMLYEKFIDKKREIFMDKVNPYGYAAGNQTFNNDFDECLVYHRVLALETIFVKTQYELFLSHRQTVGKKGTNVLNIGIVQKLNNDYHFIHRTFAEYFIAVSLLWELQQQNDNTDFLMFLIDRILWEEEYKVIRTFLNSFLQNVVDDLPATIFQKYLSLKFEVFFPNENPHTFLIHSLAREGCKAILELILKCIDYNSINNRATKENIALSSTPNDIDDIQFNELQYLVREHGIDINNYGENTPPEDTVNDNKITKKNVGFFPEVPKDIAGNTLSEIQFLLREDGIDVTNVYSKNTPLHFAVQYNRLEMTKFLIKQGANINRTRNSHTPLGQAVGHGHFDIVQFLVEQGADIKTEPDLFESSPLYQSIDRDHVDIAVYLMNKIYQNNRLDPYDLMIPYMAAYLGRLDILKELIRQGLDVNSTIEDGKSLLSFASNGCQLETIEYLVEQGANLDIQENVYGNTILHDICTKPLLIPAVLKLIDLGADVNFRNYDKWTVLHQAVEGGICDMVEVLVNNGAKVNCQEMYGITPLSLAVENSHLDMVKYLKSKGADIHKADGTGLTPLHASVEGGLDILKFLVESGTDVNNADRRGRTVLHLAAMHGKLDVVEYLIEQCGMFINTKTHSGQTPFQIAVIYSQVQVVEYFIAKYGDCLILEGVEASLLHLAAKSGHLDVLNFILDHGVDVDVEDKKGRPAIYFAVTHGGVDTVSLLLKRGAKISSKNNSLLLSARKPDSFHTTKLLVEHGVDVNIQDERGNTALHYAAELAHSNLVTFLIARGADVNIRNKMGHTALYFATASFQTDPYLNLDMRHKYCIKYLIEKQAKACKDILQYWWEITSSITQQKAVVKYRDGAAALHLARVSPLFSTNQDYKSIVRSLILAGADISLIQGNERIVLHQAVIENDLDTIKFLVNHGVDIDIKDKKERTALHLAVLFSEFNGGSRNIVEFLIQNGANLHIEDLKGVTPALLAEENGFVELYEYLKENENKQSMKSN